MAMQRKKYRFMFAKLSISEGNKKYPFRQNRQKVVAEKKYRDSPKRGMSEWLNNINREKNMTPLMCSLLSVFLFFTDVFVKVILVIQKCKLCQKVCCSYLKET